MSTNLITPKNINEILLEVHKKLEEAESILFNPGCSSEEVAEFRCEALNSVRKSSNVVRNLIRNTYTLQ